MSKGTRVNVIGIGDGTVINVRPASALNDALYTVELDHNHLTPDGLFIARGCELRTLQEAS